MEGFEPPTDQSKIVKLSTAPRGTRRLRWSKSLVCLLDDFSSNSSMLSEPIWCLEYISYSNEKCKKMKTSLVCWIFGFYTSRLERFCIPFYGIFKTESLSDRVRVRPAASRRWLSTKTVLHFVRRFGGFVWRFRGSGRAIVLSRSRWISSLLIFWPRTRTEIWTKKNFFFFSHAEWKTLQLVSLPQFQFALISWMKRPVFDVFDCSFIPDCFLLQFSLFLCCSIRRSPADFLERPAKRSGCTVTNSRATSSRAGCPRRKTPTPFALACRKRSRISLSLTLGWTAVASL